MNRNKTFDFVQKRAKKIRKMKNVVSFSGGKDSTAMLLMMVEKKIQIDEIIFIDTMKEFPKMYFHIKKVERFIRMPITRLKIDFNYWFEKHIKIKGKNKGKCGYSWPDFKNRWCTALKRDVVKKHLHGQEYQDYRGIAYDEKHRINKNQDGIKIIYPLVEWKITEKQTLQYCYNKGFHWNGLYKNFNRVSCFCCPLKRINELRNLYKFYPGLWKELKRMDKKTYRDFRPNCSLLKLEKRFKDEQE